MSSIQRKPILDDALGAVGFTPLIRLDRIAAEEGLKCNLLGKVEFFSVGGSIKDRIAKKMVEEAEKDGRLIPGKSVVIEPTSGNTGIGLGLACALKGYPLIITLPDKMSMEKELLLRCLGAEIVRTPTAAPSHSPESNLGVAKTLAEKIPYGIILDQYYNPNNPLAHELATGPEIIDAIEMDALSTKHKSSGKVDALVAGAGTGGTLTGLSTKFTKYYGEGVVAIVGVDPVGSILAPSKDPDHPDVPAPYLVEGIGYDFVPGVCDRSKVHHWVKTTDDEAWTASQRLRRHEALLVGGSSGSNLAGAIKWLKETSEGKEKNLEGKNVVVILPDGIRNYMSKDWFQGALDAQPASALSSQIKQALGKK